MTTGGGFIAGSIIGKMVLDMTGWKQSIATVDKDGKALGSKFDALGQKFQDVGTKMTAIGGAITASFSLMIKKTADYGDKMDEMSQRTGASVELLTGLDSVLKKNGASAQDLATGMKFLAGKMVDANSGNKEAIALFEGLGISIIDVKTKALRPVADVLFDVATKFKGMETSAIKTTAAVDLFGRGGMSLIPTLNLGADGLTRETEAAGRYGKVLTKEAAKACSDFNDALVDLGSVVQGVGIRISSTLMPAVQGLIKSVTDAVMKVGQWTKSHEDLTRVLATTTFALGGMMTALGPMLYMLPGLIKGWQSLAAALNLSTAALGASVIGLTALVAAAAIAYDIVTRLTNAKNEATDADYRAFESNQKLGQKLREVADAAGLTRAEFHQLSLKYDDNNAAMAMAIKRGAEGKEMQTALAKVGKEHAAVIDEQRKKMAEMDPVTRALQEAMANLRKETKTLAEQLGLLLKVDLEKKFSDMLTALDKYKGKLTEPGEKKLMDDLIALRAELDNTKPYVYSLADTLQALFDGIDTRAEEVADAISTLFSDGFDDIKKAGEQALEDDLPAHLKDLPLITKKVTKDMGDYFAGLYNDIAIGLGNAIEGFLTGWTDAEKAAIQGIRDALWSLKSEYEKAQADLDKLYKDGLISEKDYLAKSKLLLDDYNKAYKKLCDDMGEYTTGFAKLFKSVWESIKTAFFRIIGEMIAKWVLGFIPAILVSLGILKKVVDEDTEAISFAFTDAFKKIALAAADLVISLGFIAVAIAGLLGFFGLLGDTQKDFLAAIAAEKAALDALIQRWLDYGYSIRDATQRMKEYLGLIASGGGGEAPGRGAGERPIRERPGRPGGPRTGNFAEGGIAWIPQLARVAEREPEIIMPLRQYRGAQNPADAGKYPQGGGPSGPVNLTFHIKALDGADMINVVHNKIKPILQNILNHNGLRVPTSAVGGA